MEGKSDAELQAIAPISWKTMQQEKKVLFQA